MVFEMSVCRGMHGFERIQPSSPCTARHGVDFFASAVRSEWAIETGYHGKRDFAYCEDVRTRRCKANIIGAMMLARTPAFVFMAKRGVTNSQAFKEELLSDHAISLRMIVDERSN